MSRYREAAERGAQWCLARQNKDGSIAMDQDCFDGIYKFPVTFVALGHYVEAAKLLNWIEDNALTDDGDLKFPERKFLFEWHQRVYMYANSWIIIGAQRAGFFSLADRAMRYFVRYQNRDTGAFQSGPIKSDASGLCDTTITAQGGICCLYTGRHREALRAAALEYANWLVETQKPDGRWMSDEPDYPWYFIYDCTAEMAFWLSEITRLLSAPHTARQ